MTTARKSSVYIQELFFAASRGLCRAFDDIRRPPVSSPHRRQLVSVDAFTRPHRLHFNLFILRTPTL